MDTTYIHLVGKSTIRLWGLCGRERLERMLGPYEHTVFVDDIANIPPGSWLLLIRADYLYDPRLLAPVLEWQGEMVLLDGDKGDPVAIRSRAENADRYRDSLAGNDAGAQLASLEQVPPSQLVSAYDSRLLKYDPVKILAINAANVGTLERELYDGSYKGITDFVTKWLWPAPARLAVRLAVRFGVSANAITLFSLLLAVLAGIAFWNAYLFTGLVLGWVMTFLDTVDGKLARVTLTSSKIGDVLDHGLDLVHPPLWYLAWGVGISGTWLDPAMVMPMFWIILLAYLGGRFCEGGFELWIAPFRLFLWQPLDSFNRLVTARRNPNLVLLTGFTFAGRPDLGLYSVALWHVLSTFFLLWRVLEAAQCKKQGRALQTWLDMIDPVADRDKLAVRLFTRLPRSTDAGRAGD